MKTVLFLEQQAWRGGAQRVLESVIDCFSEEGFRSIAVFPGPGPFRQTLSEQGIETLDFPVGEYRSGRKSFPEKFSFALRSLVCGVRLALTIKRKDVALVYINGPRCLPAGVMAALLTGVPAIFHLHLVLTRHSEVLFVAWLSRYVSRVLACSQAAAQPLLNAAPCLSEVLAVVYNPVAIANGVRLKENAFVDVPDQRQEFTVGMVGRVTRGKGQHLLLQAIAGLPQRVQSRLRVVIVGAPAPGSQDDLRYAEDLHAFVSRYDLHGRVVWAGYQHDVRPWYDSMDVLVHCPLMEAMGLAILEASRHGVPVIASRTGGIPEIVEDGTTGLLIDAEDAYALGQAIVRFIDEEPLRLRLKQGVRSAWDERFSKSVFAARIRTLAEQLCGPRPWKGSEVFDRKAAPWK